MKYRKFPKIQDKEISVLGFGTMRLPLINNTKEIDVETTRTIIKTAISEGVNYFDTAYPYHEEKSEVVLGKILKEESLRDSIYIADKCPTWLINDENDFEKILDEQLSRLQTDYIDFYLLHALNATSWEKIKKLHGLQFLEKAKRSGKIKHIGFSFHDSFDVFKKIIDEYNNWEFCQIQYNYIDEDTVEKGANPGWQALAYAGRKSIGVIVMEPLHGGLLATPPKNLLKIFASAETPRIPAEWAFKFVWESQDVVTALSGMNSLDQIFINCALASAATPNSLPQKELEVIEKAKKWFTSRIITNCTGCRYCMPCPQKIDIPSILRIYNQASMKGAFEENQPKTVSLEYKQLFETGYGADKCISCRACETKCPQNIDISEKIKIAHKKLI